MDGEIRTADIRLPDTACLRSMTLANPGGTDQVASLGAHAGWDAFERPLPHYLYAVARARAGLVVDVGANTGFYSVLAASASDRTRVVSFEPVPDIADMLDRNIGENGLRDRVSVLRCALSDTVGTAELFLPSAEHGLIETSASLERSFKDTHSGTIRVPVNTLDRALSGLSLGRAPVALIKIDVEGHEAAVLAGASATIRRCRPVLFVEVLPGCDLQRLNRFIVARGYRDVRLRPDRPPQTAAAIEFDPDSWNHALVPGEALGAFMTLAPAVADDPPPGDQAG